MARSAGVSYTGLSQNVLVKSTIQRRYALLRRLVTFTVRSFRSKRRTVMTEVEALKEEVKDLKKELKRYKTLVELKGLDISSVDVLFHDFEPAMCMPLKDVYQSLYSRVISIALERDCEYLGDLAILYHYGKTVHGLGVLNLDTGYYSIKNILASHGISLPLTHDVFVKWLKIRPRGLDGYPIKKENTND
jgi:hypothetical protein